MPWYKYALAIEQQTAIAEAIAFVKKLLTRNFSNNVVTQRIKIPIKKAAMLSAILPSKKIANPAAPTPANNKVIQKEYLSFLSIRSISFSNSSTEIGSWLTLRDNELIISIRFKSTLLERTRPIRVLVLPSTVMDNMIPVPVTKLSAICTSG